MAAIDRVRVTWNGLGGLPGLSTFYFDNPLGAANAAVYTFFNSIKALFPAPLSWEIPNSGDTIESMNGNLIGEWTGAGGGTVNAVNAAAFAAGCGTRVVWNTASIVGGRRVRGSTFLVPLLAATYDGTGTIVNGDVATIAAAAGVLSAPAGMVIWHRPTPSDPNGGLALPVTGSGVPDRVSTLRSRRT
jgi:hypothetical protein